MLRMIPIALALVTLAPAQAKPLTVETLWSMGRVSDPQVSPDGGSVAFTVMQPDMKKNGATRAIHLVPLSGGPSRVLTSDGAAPRFSPDGAWLYFRSGRGGSSQVWRLPLAGGGEAMQVTDLPVNIGDFAVSSDGKRLVFTAQVWPEAATLEDSAKRDAEHAKRPSSARVYTKLLYRHWNAWRDGRRSHVLVYSIADKKVVDVSPGDADAPPVSLEYGRGFAIDPDGAVVAFSRNATDEPATNTNNDVFVTPIAGVAPKAITVGEGNDHSPGFSPDGRWISYLSMARPGFEADRNVLTLRPRSKGEVTALTASLDRSVSSYVWSPDSKWVYFTATDRGRVPIYRVSVGGGAPEKLFGDGCSSGLTITPDGKTLVFTNQAFDRPYEVWALDVATKKARKVSSINDAIVAKVEMGRAEEFWFKGAKDEQVQGFVLTPPGFDPTRKYPAVMLIHGGPQGAFTDSFHWRWNAQLWCAPGYVGIIVNFHGSRGYGQAFCDAVSRDWGGAPYEDVMLCLDHAVKAYPYIDGSRVGAAGGSYGGFMVNWICGKTDRFKCLVSHAGVVEHWSMYGATEEIWFPQWEFGGAPWDDDTLHRKWSPVRLAKNFKTPMLVIHGEQDYRVPYTQGLQMFTALQLRGVPSKLLFFPDEDHWIHKPQNAKVWWNTIHDWLRTYLKGSDR